MVILRCDYRPVQVKRRKCISRPKSTPFFRVKNVKICARLLCALMKTWPDSFFFRHDFPSIKTIWENLDLFRPNIFGEKKKKLPRRLGLGINTCAKFQGLSLENSMWALDFCAEKCEICVIAFGYLVSVYYRLNIGPLQSDLRIFARNSL